VNIDVVTGSLRNIYLDWVIAKIENPNWFFEGYVSNDPASALMMDDGQIYDPSTNYVFGGPILDKAVTHIQKFSEHKYHASIVPSASGDGDWHHAYGPTILIASLRCYAKSHFGLFVSLPKALFAVSRATHINLLRNEHEFE
jgi:hypothetical protein